MTDSTEPTIDEILEITRYNLKTSPDEIFDKGVVINAKNLIQAHIAKEVAKARIDELEDAIIHVNREAQTPLQYLERRLAELSNKENK